ncbi:MAG: benzoate-CoA ligase family protein [Pseudomonadota bacterium]
MTDRANGNAALYFVDRHVDEGRSERVAFQEVDGAGRTLTYGALAARTAAMAGALARANIQREQRIALIMLDTIELPTVFWGALKAGVVPMPMNTLLTTDIYRAMLQDARPTALFVSSALWPVVAPLIPDLPGAPQVIVVGDAVPGTTSYDAFVDGAPAAPVVSVSGDEVAFWLFSSGSTGAPKGVKHIHSALKATSDTFGAQVLGIQPDDVVYSAAKIFFAYGLGNAMTFPMSVGATTLLLGGRPTPDGILEIMEDARPTVFCGVPTLFAALVAAAATGAPEHRIRLSVSAGEALPKEIGDRWDKLWGSRIIDGVGSTEMLHIFLSNRPDDIVYGTSGLAVPGYDVRLVDDAGAEVAPGDIGELMVNGPSSADGYWNRRAKSQDTFVGAWTKTGDKYERTSDGRYIYCGRSDDMFKVSGMWLSPFEVEQALIGNEAVLEAAVVARRDADGLEKPAAFVVLKPGAATPSDEVLKEEVKAKAGLWKYPRWIEFVDDLPKTATGKIQRFKLRDAAQ